jgi:hypothetical protein
LLGIPSPYNPVIIIDTNNFIYFDSGAALPIVDLFAPPKIMSMFNKQKKAVLALILWETVLLA